MKREEGMKVMYQLTSQGRRHTFWSLRECVSSVLHSNLLRPRVCIELESPLARLLSSSSAWWRACLHCHGGRSQGRPSQSHKYSHTVQPEGLLPTKRVVESSPMATLPLPSFTTRA